MHMFTFAPVLLCTYHKRTFMNIFIKDERQYAHGNWQIQGIFLYIPFQLKTELIYSSIYQELVLKDKKM